MRYAKRLLLASSATLLLAPAALAQVQGAAADSTSVQEVVVTGSRIARPNLDQPTPISTLSAQTIVNSGTGNLADIITRLPSAGFTGTVRANSNNFGNGAGLAQVDLRSLGISRTLVLVDGQRHVAGDLFTGAVDVNSIPTALVDRIEVITGGASAIYGSDAVTGVVNIILKKKFEGVDVQAEGGGYDNGFGANYNVYGTVGHNMMDGKLNLTATAYWTKQAGIDVGNIPTAHNYGTVVNSADLAPGKFDPAYFRSVSPIRRNGIPDRLYVQNVGSDYLSTGGTLIDPNTGLPAYAFNAAGSVVPVPKRSGYNSAIFGQLPADCGVTCYYGEKYAQLQSPIETKGFDFTANYDFTPHLHATLDAKYAQSDVQNPILPSYTLEAYQLQPDNGFIRPDLAAALAGTDGADYPLIDKIFNNPRGGDVRRQTFRFVAGLSGDFDAKFSQIKWDGTLNYGETDTRFKNSGLAINNNLTSALDSVIDPATGKAACRINVPSAAAEGLPYGEAATPDARCSPLDPFGTTQSYNAEAYAFGTFISRDKLTQQVANLNATFDTGRFFNLQGGPLAFAVGGEYRMERAREINDPALTDGSTEFLSSNSAGGFNVYEGYIEASAPVFLHAGPGLDELTFDSAYRGSQYSSVGHTDAYKFSAVYGPFRDIKFRGTYSRAVRAPNITEAFSPTSGTYFNVTDPCDASNVGSNVNYAANCKAAGVQDDFSSNTNNSIVGTTSGNKNLDPEKSISYTGGVVLQPHWVPRLSITLDYYSIKIKNAITEPDPQDIVDNCYNGARLDAQYCSLFTRGEDNNINSLTQTFVNASKLFTDGIDLQADYSVGVSGLTDRFAWTKPLDGKLAFSLNANYVIHLRNFPFQNIPDQVNINEGTKTTPKLRAFSSLSYAQGGWTVTWQVNYLGRTANFNRDATTVDKAESSDIPFNKQEFVHDLIVRYALQNGFAKGGEVFVGVNNLTGEMPPGYLVGGGNDLGYSLGRYIFGGVRFRR